MLDVLRLRQTDEGQEPIEEIYRRYGFFRQWQLYALLREHALKAFFIVNHSSPGLNLSELLNSITVIVTDPAGLPWEVLTTALAHLTPEYHAESVTLLIYPAKYPSEQGVKVDRRYDLWIIDTQYANVYLDYMDKKMKLTFKFLFKYLLRKMVPK